MQTVSIIGVKIERRAHSARFVIDIRLHDGECKLLRRFAIVPADPSAILILQTGAHQCGWMLAQRCMFAMYESVATDLAIADDRRSVS